MDRSGLTQTDASWSLRGDALVIQLNSFATPARTQDLLRSLAFRNSGNNPGASWNFSVFVKDDQSNTSNTQWVGLNIANDDDAPVLAGRGTSLQYVENTWLTSLMTGGTVSDDNVHFSGGTLAAQVTTNRQADDVLAIMRQGNGANQIGVDTITGEVKYGGQVMGTFSGGTSGNPLVVSFTTSAATRTITFTLNDGSSGSDNAYAAVNVVPSNDAPVISGVSGSTTYTKGTWLEALPMASPLPWGG